MRRSGVAPASSNAGGGLRLLNRSSLAEWLKCAYRYDLGVNRNIQSRAIVRAPELGTAVHVGLEAIMKMHHATLLDTKGKAQEFTDTMTSAKVKARVQSVTKSYLSQLLAKGREAIELWLVEQRTLRGNMSPDDENALTQIGNDALDIMAYALPLIRLEAWATLEGPKGPMLEQSFTLKTPELAPWDGVHITPDWVAYNLDYECTLLVDYKVRGQFTTEDDAEIDLQAPMYLEVLRRLNIFVAGDAHIQILSQAPSQPKTNKDGSMSRASIRTTWNIYRTALIKAGLDPADYQDMRVKLADVQFVHLLPTMRSPDTTIALWNEVVVPTAKAMAAMPHWKTRNLNFFSCRGCWARAMCMAELHGDDTDFLLQTQYMDTKRPAPRVVFDISEMEGR